MAEDLVTVCDGAVRAVNDAVDAQSTAMYLFSKRGQLDRVASIDAGGKPLPTGKGERYYDLIRQSVVANDGSKYASVRRYVVADDGRTFPIIDARIAIKAHTEILCLPLNGPNRTYGTIRCVRPYSPSIADSNPDDLIDLPAFCDQVAIAVSNIRRQHELAVHDRISTLVTSPFDLVDAFQAVAELLVDAWTDYAACTIRTIDDRGEFVLVGMHAAPGATLDKKRRAPKSPTEGLPARALATGEPQIVLHVQDQLHLFSDPRWIENNSFETAIVLPVTADEHKIGTLTLFAWFDITFSTAQLRFLQAVCKALATATTISRLVQARDQLIERLRDLVSPDQTTDDLLQTILEGARDLTGGSQGYIALTQKGDRLLHPCTFTDGLRPEHIPSISIDGDGLTALAAREQRTVVCNDTRVAAAPLAHIFVDLLSEWAGRVNSEIAVPMIYANRLLGVIAIESERSGCFASDDAAIMKTLAGTATLVFQRHRFHEATTHLANLALPRTDRAALHARLAEAAAKLVDADAAVLCVLEGRPRRLAVADAWPSSLKNVPTELAEGTGLCWRSLRSHAPEWFPDISSASGFFHHGFAEENGLRSMLAIPLLLTSSSGDDEEELGVLNAFFTSDTEPLRPEVELMRAFAVAASHALGDAHFLDERERTLTFSASIARLRAIAEVGASLQDIARNLAQIDRDLHSAEQACSGCGNAACVAISRAAQSLSAARAHLAAVSNEDGESTMAGADERKSGSLLRLITKQVYESGMGPALHVSEAELWDTITARLHRIAKGLQLGSAAAYFARAYDYAALHIVSATRRDRRAPATLTLPTFEVFRELQRDSPVELPSKNANLEWLDPGSLIGNGRAQLYAREFIGGNLLVVIFGLGETSASTLTQRAILHEMVNEQVFAYVERAAFRLELDQLTSETGHLMGDAVGKVTTAARIITDTLARGAAAQKTELFRSAVHDLNDGARRLKLIRQNFYAFSSETSEAAGKRGADETFDFVAMLNEMREIFDAAAARQELDQIKYDVRPKRVQVRGWKDMLQLTLLNLMDNACKFAYKNTFVELRVSASDGRCLLTVENIGVGVASDEQAHVFQRLRRSRFRDPHRHIEGVGLGLPFCRRIVEQVFHGTITLTSRPVGPRANARFEGDNWLTSVTVMLPSSDRRRRL